MLGGGSEGLGVRYVDAEQPSGASTTEWLRMSIERKEKAGLRHSLYEGAVGLERMDGNKCVLNMPSCGYQSRNNAAEAIW
jgi:hypothetical protein